jgi:hypothetical protein
MTVDMVATRTSGKATLYRRWPSKAELVIEAVACMKSGSPAELPDTDRCAATSSPTSRLPS